MIAGANLKYTPDRLCPNRRPSSATRRAGMATSVSPSRTCPPAASTSRASLRCLRLPDVSCPHGDHAGGHAAFPANCRRGEGYPGQPEGRRAVLPAGGPHRLSAATRGDPRRKTQYELARYIVHYADGQTARNPGLLRDRRGRLPSSEIADAHPRRADRLDPAVPGHRSDAVAYSMQWNNPRPNVAMPVHRHGLRQGSSGRSCAAGGDGGGVRGGSIRRLRR